jgi:hypothetical protein
VVKTAALKIGAREQRHSMLTCNLLLVAFESTGPDGAFIAPATTAVAMLEEGGKVGVVVH